MSSFVIILASPWLQQHVELHHGVTLPPTACGEPQARESKSRSTDFPQCRSPAVYWPFGVCTITARNEHNKNSTDINNCKQMVYGKSRVLQVLLRMTADPTLTEEDLVDLLMDVLADETPGESPSGKKMREGESSACVTSALPRRQRLWLGGVRC